MSGLHKIRSLCCQLVTQQEQKPLSEKVGSFHTQTPPHPGHRSPILPGATQGSDLPTNSRGLPADLTGYFFFNWAAECISLSVNCLQMEPHMLPREGSGPRSPRVGEVS